MRYHYILRIKYSWLLLIHWLKTKWYGRPSLISDRFVKGDLIKRRRPSNLESWEIYLDMEVFEVLDIGHTNYKLIWQDIDKDNINKHRYEVIFKGINGEPYMHRKKDDINKHFEKIGISSNQVTVEFNGVLKKVLDDE